MEGITSLDESDRLPSLRTQSRNNTAVLNGARPWLPERATFFNTCNCSIVRFSITIVTHCGATWTHPLSAEECDDDFCGNWVLVTERHHLQDQENRLHPSLNTQNLEEQREPPLEEQLCISATVVNAAVTRAAAYSGGVQLPCRAWQTRNLITI